MGAQAIIPNRILRELTSISSMLRGCWGRAPTASWCSVPEHCPAQKRSQQTKIGHEGSSTSFTQACFQISSPQALHLSWVKALTPADNVPDTLLLARLRCLNPKGMGVQQCHSGHPNLKASMLAVLMMGLGGLIAGLGRGVFRAAFKDYATMRQPRT